MLDRHSILFACLLVGCDDGRDPVLPDVAPDVAKVSYEIVHNRLGVDRMELGLGSLDGAYLPVRVLTGGVGAAGRAAVSPDGRRIALWSFDELRGAWQLILHSLEDGTESTIVWVRGSSQLAWSPDGSRLAFATIDDDRIARVYSFTTGGELRFVASVDGVAIDCIAPQWSPDGLEFAFSTGLAIVSYSDGSVRQIVAEDPDRPASVCEPRWSPDGSSLAYARRRFNNLQDIVRVERGGGTPISIAPISGGFGAGQVQWSPDGSRIAYVTFDEDASDAALGVVDAYVGSPILLDHLGCAVSGGHPQWSPDGETLLYVVFDEGVKLATIPATGGSRTLLLPGASIDGTYPAWLREPIVR